MLFREEDRNRLVSVDYKLNKTYDLLIKFIEQIKIQREKDLKKFESLEMKSQQDVATLLEAVQELLGLVRGWEKVETIEKKTPKKKDKK